MEAADECGQHVSGLEVEGVAGTVEIGRHGGDPVATVLVPIGLHADDPGDLGDGVGVVGRLQWAGEQRRLRDRLRCHPGIDARRAEEEQSVDISGVRGLKEIGLDAQVVGEEFDRVRRVGHDATDFGRGDHDDIGPSREHRIQRRVPIGEVHLGGGPADEIGEARRLQGPPHSGADHAAMAGDIDPRIGREHAHGSTVVEWLRARRG